MLKQVPLMILSDSPDRQSGLARVCRDLATLASSMSEFRVATLGLGGSGAQSLPWVQYQLQPGDFGERSLPHVWEDFTEGQPGVLLTIFDLHRILWLARPEFTEEEGLRQWIVRQRQGRKLRLWSYVPVDAVGPCGKLTGMAADVLVGIERILMYTPWAKDLVIATIGAEAAGVRGIAWMPHAVNMKIFQPVDVAAEPRSVHRVGCVMTNQMRKDWGTVAAVSSELVKKLEGNVRFWWHSDTVERHWNLRALAADYGISELVDITVDAASDQTMADRYRGCDLTLLPSSEGFGFPIFESLACGVPCLHGDYAGGASLLREFGLRQLLVPVEAGRVEGVHNSVRPVFDPLDWVRAAMDMLSTPPDGAWLRERVEHLDMRLLGHRWKQWLREGVANAK